MSDQESELPARHIEDGRSHECDQKLQENSENRGWNASLERFHAEQAGSDRLGEDDCGVPLQDDRGGGVDQIQYSRDQPAPENGFRHV